MHGECGAPGAPPLVLQPTEVQDLSGQPVSSLAAGTAHSAAVLRGEAWTWGRNASGQLGHGTTNGLLRPQR